MRVKSLCAKVSFQFTTQAAWPLFYKCVKACLSGKGLATNGRRTIADRAATRIWLAALPPCGFNILARWIFCDLDGR
jgi:hypothetical protein